LVYNDEIKNEVVKEKQKCGAVKIRICTAVAAEDEFQLDH